MSFPFFTDKRVADENDDNSVLVKRESLTYEHDVTVYIPVFQKDFNDDGTLMSSPTFEYRFTEADSDEQMVASLEPDYILELTGKFKATTKPLMVRADELKKNWRGTLS
jgi:hypothetical protein